MKNEYECMDYIRDLVSFLPQNNTEDPPILQSSDNPTALTIILWEFPENEKEPYDMSNHLAQINLLKTSLWDFKAWFQPCMLKKR